MLETLFAHAVQKEIFLLALRWGVALGAVGQGLNWLRRCMPALRWMCDVLLAASGAAMLLGVTLHSGDGVRLYALLGMLLGVLLYTAGAGRVLEAAGRSLHKIYEKFHIPKEGKPPARRE